MVSTPMKRLAEARKADKSISLVLDSPTASEASTTRVGTPNSDHGHNTTETKFVAKPPPREQKREYKQAVSVMADQFVENLFSSPS